MKPSLTYSLALVAGMSLCSLTTYAASDAKALKKQYRQSIKDAAVIQPNEVKAVAPITAERAQFVTWTAYPDSYKPGSELTLGWGETWVTQDGAVLNECKQFDKANLNIHIQQLLGLPPEADAKRYFAVLEVETKDMFRPCASPSLTATECSANFSEGVSEAHKAWYAGQSAVAYQLPQGYPWTRLGYTYDWNPATDEEGVFEFVIKKGATVKVVSLTPTAEYCQ